MSFDKNGDLEDEYVLSGFNTDEKHGPEYYHYNNEVYKEIEF